MRRLLWEMVAVLIVVLCLCVAAQAGESVAPGNQAQWQSQMGYQDQTLNNTNNINVNNKVNSTSISGAASSSKSSSASTATATGGSSSSTSDASGGNVEINNTVSGKAFRQYLYMDSDGFPSLPAYNGPWTGPSWNVLPLEYLPSMITLAIAESWVQGDSKCEFYPYRPRPKYVQTEFYLKTVGKENKAGKHSLPLKKRYELVGFVFCRATFDGTTLSMVGRTAQIGMENGATTAVILGASEEFDPRSWSIGLNLGGAAGLIDGAEGERGYGVRAGLGASYGGSKSNKGQGLVFLLADEYPDK